MSKTGIREVDKKLAKKKELRIVERHEQGWSFSKSQSKIFPTLDDVFEHLEKTYEDFKIVAVTDNFVIFLIKTKEDV